MTEDYKKNLINYMTGNLVEGTPTTEEIIKEQIEIPRTDYVYKYSPNGWYDMRIEGFIKPNVENGNIGVLYGGYEERNGNHDPYGFIILVDQNMKPIKYIDSFEDGTRLRYIQCMIQGDDNLFYAIDDAEMSFNNTNISNTQKRFLMLNNFLVNLEGDYIVRLRKSYILNGSYYQNFYCKNIYKEPNRSNFVFCGDYASSSNAGASRIKAIQLIINVGSENEWHYWYVPENFQSIANFVKFDGSGNSFIQFVGVGVSGHYVYLYTKGFNDNAYTRTTLHTFAYDTFTAAWDGITQQGVFLDENNVYFVIDNQRLLTTDPITHERIPHDKYLGLYHYNILTDEFETIYERYLGTSTNYDNYEKIQLDKNEGQLYIAYYNNFINNTTADYYFQRYEGEWDPILVGENKPYATSSGYNHRGLYVNSQYNLLLVALYPIQWSANWWYFKELKEVYNPTQYNGEPYVSKDSLCPLFSNLYSNGSLVFSRNLYNISKQNNMTMSSVEIPNTYLNGIDITQNDLLSETNLEMNNDLTGWNKNIYEVVDLNFLNTITIIDEDNNVEYLEGAIKLNQATTDGGATNYTNAPCTKYRINYVDNTTDIQELIWNSIDDTHKECEISLYVDKAILSIDLISHDESSIYLTIPLEVEIGKYYTINQKVRIGG